MQSPASFFEDVLRFVVESSPVAMITCDENGLIRSASPQAENILGYNRNELLGRSVESLVPMGARQRHASLRHGFAESPSLRAMGSGRNLWALRRDSSSIPVEIGLAPLKIDNGLIILATLVDISERQAAENALAGDFAQSNGKGDFAARVEAVLRCVPDGAVAIDKEGFVKTANPSAQEFQDRFR